MILLQCYYDAADLLVTEWRMKQSMNIYFR